jgi:ATP-dependent exoDNAse (exonuclease V) beta subunit
MTAPVSFRPIDHEARERARRELQTSFVLEAGAGTGKTTLLVDRIETLVRQGAATLDRIAAVTFTENAATTMKLRLRERLERLASDSGVPSLERERSAAALDVLERAPICTIHALCAAMLQERPLECDVVPGFRMADETEADVLFAEAWEEWLADRLTGTDDVLLEALDADIPLEGQRLYGERSSLRGLARQLVEQRDLRPLTGSSESDPALGRAELLMRAERGLELSALAKPGDVLAARLQSLAQYAEAARGLEGRALVAHLALLEGIPKSFGHRPKWPSEAALAEARGIAAWTKQAQESWSAWKAESLHGRLVSALLGVVEAYQRKKAERGLLDFLDLLLKARDALRDRESVRRYFEERFRYLIIDEFQDTDPLQVEIAQMLSGHAAGDLVVVGDAKQSIYRFRRAEVALFRKVSEQARAQSGRDVLHLTQNFRSRPAILRFVNRAFGELIQASSEAGQPAYEPIEPPPLLPEEPSVVALGFDAAFEEGEGLLRAEANALAAFIAEAARGGFSVRDPETAEARKSRAGDVMVLARRLTQMRILEDALVAAGLRFTVEGGKSFFDRQEVHETLAALNAIEDPSDRVSLVGALRSSFFGVSDRDIVSYALSGGALWLGAPDMDKPGAACLGPALELLERLHRERTRLSVAALLERLFDETRILAALTLTRRGEARIANLEKVVALARQATELGVLTVRGFARLVAERITSAREEPDLPTTRPGDPDTLRILSVHKAKGLEAPIVVLYDSADELRPRAETIPLWDEGSIAIGFRAGCQPPRWEELKGREEARGWAEGRRLLYVACTRARDWLVIPKPPGDARTGSFWKELVAYLPAESDADVVVMDAATLRVPSRDEEAPDLRALAAAEGGDALAARWDQTRREEIQAAAQRPFVPISATQAAGRTAPPPVATGGAGREFGRLVHRILEWIPLDQPEHARPMAEALAPGFGLDAAAAARAADAVSRVLALPVMQRARRAQQLYRELPLVFPDGSDLVEGVIDLAFEEDGELVIVDYKTDAIADEQALAQAAHHAPQLQLYGRGLAQARGQRVRERLVLFTTPGRVVAV